MQIEIKNREEFKKAFEEEVKEKIDNKFNTFRKILLYALQKATPIDTGKARYGWRLTPYGLTNEVEYISKLNEGTSKQAPSHFVEKTLLRQEGVRPSGIIVRHK